MTADSVGGDCWAATLGTPKMAQHTASLANMRVLLKIVRLYLWKSACFGPLSKDEMVKTHACPPHIFAGIPARGFDFRDAERIPYVFRA